MNGQKSLLKYLLFKYLRFDKEQPFIMLSMLLAFVGVCVGLCVLLVAMAIMNGFDKGLKERFFVMNYPLTVVSKVYTNIDDDLVGNLQKNFKDLAFSPFINTQVITRGNGKFEGGLLFGIHSQDEKKINKVVAEALGQNELKGFEGLLAKLWHKNLPSKKAKNCPSFFQI